MNVYRLFLIIIIAFALSGCAQISETAKVIWGSSTKALENARDDAISKTYRCSLNDCYDAVLTLARAKRVYVDYKNIENEESVDASDEEEKDVKEIDPKVPAPAGHFDVFIKNRKKRHIVVMGISGNVDTTEAGIFFTQPTLTTVKLEVSSLSSSAKRTVSEIVFTELDTRFSAAE